jgi:hypothetical protein
MNEKFTVDMLTSYSVSLKKQNFAMVDGIEYAIGEPWRKAYVNSTSGRAEVESEVSDPYKTAIFAIWGDTPTVDDPSVD